MLGLAMHARNSWSTLLYFMIQLLRPLDSHFLSIHRVPDLTKRVAPLLPVD